MKGSGLGFFSKRRKSHPQPPVFSFERTLRRPDLSPRAAEYGFEMAA
jgi:hypothetical protein